MVSVEPTQTEAARPTKLSAPYRVSVSPRSAREALPEKGRSKISGVSSEGMPIFSKTGESQLPRASSAPHPRRSVIAPSIAARAGKTRRSVGTASAAPRIKASYGFTRRIRAYASSAATSIGITNFISHPLPIRKICRQELQRQQKKPRK